MKRFLRSTFFKIIAALALVIIAILISNLLGLIALIAFFIYVFNLTKVGLYTNIGNIKHGRGNLKSAVKWYRRASKCKRAKPGIAISYSYLLLKSGMVEEADKALRAIDTSKLHEYDRIMHVSNSALVLWKKDDLDGAITLLENYSTEKNTLILGSLGYFLILKGDLDKALSYNLDAYQYNGADMVIRDNLGLNYYYLGDYPKAEEIYESMIKAKIKPGFPVAYYDYALVLIALEKFDKAKEYLKKTSGFNLNFLSSVTKEQIDERLKEIEEKLKK